MNRITITAAAALTIAALAVTACGSAPAAPSPAASAVQAPSAPASAVLAAPSVPASSTALAAPPPRPPDAPSYNAAGDIYPDPLCTQVGGDTIGGPSCSQIPYLGPDDQTYYAQVGINTDGTLQGPAQTEGTGATESECTRGYWPEYQGEGPGYAAPGKWNATLGLCQP